MASFKKAKLTILLEDEHIIVVNKPPGMLTLPDRYDDQKPNIYHQLSKERPEIYTVHRLDAETSGVLLFAKSKPIHKILNDQFSGREIEKRYRALTLAPYEDKGVIDASIGPQDGKKNRFVVTNAGKPSTTEYEVLERLGSYAYVELNLLTGRTHQIRVHLRYIGASLLVDKAYGHSSEFYLSAIKKLRKRPEEERPLIARSSLHSHSIRFIHPVNHQEVFIEAPLFKDFKAALNQLRKVK